jgi:N-acetylglucosamine kinase-like BadF-type ATPase
VRSGRNNGHVLGVDAGNTKTVAFIAHEDGTVAGIGIAGCGDIHNAPTPDAALDEIGSACSTALAAAGVRGSDLAASAFSLAGADWPEDFELLCEELAARLDLVTPPHVVNDAIGAIRCGTADGVGVAAVCGTHGTAGARNAAGAVYHFGFWPDDTGAWALGSKGLAAVLRSDLDIGEATSLTARALAWWNADSPFDLLHALTRLEEPRIPVSERALFAAAVLDEADAGDPVARDIVGSAGRRLGDFARVCAERTAQTGSEFPLVLCGGVLRHPSALLRESIVSSVPGAVPVYPSVEPVVGAVLLAADEIGARPSLDRLAEAVLSLPSLDDGSKGR